MTFIFFVQCIIKQLLDSVFVTSRIIKVLVRVISLSLRLQLITPTSTLIILDTTKTSSNYCLLYDAGVIILFLELIHFRVVHWGGPLTGGQCFVHHLFTSGKTASLAAGVLGHGLGSFTDCVSSIGFNNSSLLFCLIYSSKDLYRWRFSLTVVIKSTFNFRPKEKIKSLKSAEGF